MRHIFLFLALFLTFFDVCAVRFTSASSDEALLEFGQKFPFTCGVARGEKPPHGSGCLIDAEKPSLRACYCNSSA